MSSYKLAEDSEYGSVEVDGVLVGKSEGVELSQDQADRANDIEGVELVSAEESPEQEHESPEQSGEE